MMMIEISTLPVVLQKQILAIETGEIVTFTNHGKIIGKVVQQAPKSDSLDATFGLWQGVDGVAYERQVRSQW